MYDGKSYFIYIATNRPRGVLYVGMTSDLPRRVRRVEETNPTWRDLYAEIILQHGFEP